MGARGHPRRCTTFAGHLTRCGVPERRKGAASNGSLPWRMPLVVSAEGDVASPFRATGGGGGLKAAATWCPAMESLSATHHTSAANQWVADGGNGFGRRDTEPSGHERSCAPRRSDASAGNPLCRTSGRRR
jgi:hypothetical protein